MVPNSNEEVDGPRGLTKSSVLVTFLTVSGKVDTTLNLTF